MTDIDFVYLKSPEWILDKIPGYQYEQSREILWVKHCSDKSWIEQWHLNRIKEHFKCNKLKIKVSQ